MILLNRLLTRLPACASLSVEDLAGQRVAQTLRAAQKHRFEPTARKQTAGYRSVCPCPHNRLEKEPPRCPAWVPPTCRAAGQAAGVETPTVRTTWSAVRKQRSTAEHRGAPGCWIARNITFSNCCRGQPNVNLLLVFV